MQRRDDGHPLAAMLLLFSMFAFAFVFHAVTQPDATVAAHFDTQLAAFATPAPAISPRTTKAAAPDAPDAPDALDAPAAPDVSDAPDAPDTPDPSATLTAIMWSAAAPLPSAVAPAMPRHEPEDGGAVTRALDITRSALRTAFKKAF